jgi:C-terminal processing protease CtpA/Prc
LFAEPPVRKTIVIKDGQMTVDGKVIDVPEHGRMMIGDEVLALHDELAGGKRAWLGVSLIDLTPELREHYGAARENGVLVSSVAPDSPAAKAGVRVGDILLGVDGGDVASARDIRKSLREKKQGDSVRLELLRGRARQTVVAGVVEREGVRVMMPQIRELETRLNSPEWKARLERIGPDCQKLEQRMRELESRLKELDRKLQK